MHIIKNFTNYYMNTSNSFDRDESIGFQVIPKQSQGIKLLQKKSTYLIVMATICFLITAATGYSYWRYISTSTLPITLQSLLPIHAGQIHYSRIPREYWEHRILMIKAMGFNSLSVYVMWNHHELNKGQFDFNNGNKDLSGFLTLASKHQMKVLLRPGPYVCAEWDFGGLPARLLGIDGMKVRSTNKLYEEQAKQYLTALSKVINPFLHKKGGPIIMIQIENQLGYYTSSPEHMSNIRTMWKELQIDCQFYYQEAYQNWQMHYWPDAHIGISGGQPSQEFHQIQISPKRTNNSLFFGGEVYSGWITYWDDHWGGRQPKRFTQKFRSYVLYNRSLSVYVAVGGTNFGLTAGSNGYQFKDPKVPKFRPQITSYDYDALVTQQGRTTQKYYATREIFEEYYGHELKEIPEAIPSISIPAFKPVIIGHLWANLPEASLSKSQLTYFESNSMKMYKQGMALYETDLLEKGLYRFKATIHDYAFVFVDQRFIGSFMRKMDDTHIIEIQCHTSPCKLKILVQAMGHINFGQDMNEDRKGLLHFVEVNRPTLKFEWSIYKIQIADGLTWTKKSSNMKFPLLLGSQFEIKETGDTFIDMSGYSKGYLWVNGHLLGRYWSVGPQQRLYCPGVWLKTGINTITILQLLQNEQRPIAGHERLID